MATQVRNCLARSEPPLSLLHLVTLRNLLESWQPSGDGVPLVGELPWPSHQFPYSANKLAGFWTLGPRSRTWPEPSSALPSRRLSTLPSSSGHLRRSTS